VHLEWKINRPDSVIAIVIGRKPLSGMSMFRLSINSMMLMVAYAAICCLVYLHSSFWIGWLIVIATAIWMAMAIVHATQTQNSFTLGFAVAGCPWLIIWLGFVIETDTPPGLRPWPGGGAGGVNSLRMGIYRIASFGRTGPAKLAIEAPEIQRHDLYASEMMDIRDANFLPNLYNAMRLVVCLSALAVASVCGVLYHFVQRHCQRRCLLVANANNPTRHPQDPITTRSTEAAETPDF
jgi:type III secretory pathway component EscS